VLALSVPFVFLHEVWQPAVTVHGASLDLSVFAVGVVVLAALVAGVREGFAPLRAGVPVWVATTLFLVLVYASLLWGHADRRGTHFITAGRFTEYALLAPAVPLLLRRRREVRVFLAALVLWSTVATLVGVLQFAGVDVAGPWPPGLRQPSFLGLHDFAALSAAVLTLVLVALAFGSERRDRAWLWVAAVSGTVGLILSGASAGALGLVLAAALAAWLARLRGRFSRRTVATIAALAVVSAGGVALLRAGDLRRYAGLEHNNGSAHVQTYAQRTLLAYIGLRIWRDHPIVGVGWQGSADERGYGPYLRDAHRRYASQPAVAFPSPQHPYGIQLAYVQALADLGIVGLLALLAVFAAGLWTALRRPTPEGALAALWLVVVLGVLAALGLVAGIPVDAVWWLALGLAVAGAWRAEPR